MKFTVLGSNAALPAGGKYPTSAVLQCGNAVLLFDCGEGAQMRMEHFGIKKSKIQRIFITHMHGDHVFGLLGLITSFTLNNRKDPLHIHGPADLEPFIEQQLKLTGSRMGYPVIVHPTDPEKHEVIWENEYLVVSTLPLLHRIPANGYLVVEKPRPWRMVAEKLEEYGVPMQMRRSIAQGNDFVMPDGRVIPNAEFTRPGPSPKSFAFCTDTRFNENLPPLIQGVDLLYHEATFMHEDSHRAEDTQHSTSTDAGRIARLAGAKKLLIGHFSGRIWSLGALLDEAKKEFPNTELAEEGKSWEVGAP